LVSLHRQFHAMFQTTFEPPLYSCERSTVILMAVYGETQASFTHYSIPSIIPAGFPLP
jgi:hypothetical protein